MLMVPDELTDSLKLSLWVSICTLDSTECSAESVRQWIRKYGDTGASCIMNVTPYLDARITLGRSHRGFCSVVSAYMLKRLTAFTI